MKNNQIQIIKRKFFNGIELDISERQQVESLFPKSTRGELIDAFLYSDQSRKMYFIHIFETEQDVNNFRKEIRDSLKLKAKLCRYDEKYQENIALFRTKGLLLKTMRKLIEKNVKHQPICTAIFDSKQHVLRNHFKFTFSFKVHWENEKQYPDFSYIKNEFVKIEQPFIPQYAKVKQETTYVAWDQFHIKIKQEEELQNVKMIKEEQQIFIQID